jgi:hypothetical protein
LGAPPVTITHTPARTRAVYRKTIDELYQMLTLMEGPQAAADRAGRRVRGSTATSTAIHTRAQAVS